MYSDQVRPLDVHALEDLMQRFHAEPIRDSCIAGVVLEGDLKDRCELHVAPVVAELPTLSDYNDAAWKANLYPKTTWRIQHLPDLRNLCAHVLDREPTYEDASELLDGADDVLRELAAIPPPS